MTGLAPAPEPALERRVCRLLRWYPACWRERYGEEFAELLLAELTEQPRRWPGWQSGWPAGSVIPSIQACRHWPERCRQGR